MLFTGFSVIHYLDISHLPLLKIIKTPGFGGSIVPRPQAKKKFKIMRIRPTGKAFLSFGSSFTCWAEFYRF